MKNRIKMKELDKWDNKLVSGEGIGWNKSAANRLRKKSTKEREREREREFYLSKRVAWAFASRERERERLGSKTYYLCIYFI